MPEYLGLTNLKAQNQLEAYGPNLLPQEKPKPFFLLILDQVKSPLIYILIFAGLVTFFLKEYSDSIVIFLAVIVNTILGFYQEYKVDRALIALKKSLGLTAQTIRDGKLIELDTKDLVPGDLVILKAGEKIPADGIIIEAVDLSINEAILTGESLSVAKSSLSPSSLQSFLKNNQPIKDRLKQLFSGTNVVSGRAKYIVTKTSTHTQVGKIAQTLKTTIQEQTPLQIQLSKLAQILTIIFVLLCLLIFSVGTYLGNPVIKMFELSVAIAVSPIPEGLIISLTVILTIGMQKIFKHKALVRKLVSAETLGATTVICADKTGTLTLGQVQISNLKSTDKDLTFKATILCNNLSSSEEKTLWEYAQAHSFNGKDPQSFFEKTPRLFEIPFSSERKYMLTINSLFSKNKKVIDQVFVVGAPDILLSACSKKDQSYWKQIIEKASAQGNRLIAVATRSAPKNLSHLKNKSKNNITLADFGTFEFIGLFYFEDPVRPEVKKALAETKKAGLKIKVITGDYLATAIAVLQKIGLKVGKDQVLEGKQLDALKGQALSDKVAQTILFARTTPFQKLKIVSALKERNEVVAMTGDGVNDALALKRADIGIVVADASEVAKETADMVLLDSNLQTIVNAIKQGRVIFENIRKVVVYLLADSFTEVILVAGSFLFGLPLPLLPVQILWVNLFADSFPSFALAFEKESSDIMKEPPRPKDDPILNAEAKTIIIIIGLITDLLLFSIFIFLYNLSHDITYIRSFVFAALGIDSLLYVFSCKTFRKNIWHTNIFDNLHLNIAVLIGFLMLFITYFFAPLRQLFKIQPLDSLEWIILIILGIVEISLVEFVKWIFLNKNKAIITK